MKSQPIPSVSEEFFAPSAQYRPWPLFVLNDEFPAAEGEKRLTTLLENMARVGYGGIFIHPRPGLITEYLSPRWFEIVRHCISECRRLGLVSALYDENSYPSGFAGGHVPALCPQTASRHLIPKFGALPEQPPTDALAVYRTEEGLPVEQLAAADLPPGSGWCAFVIERMAPTAWHGELPYVSLLDPATTQTFLSTTYQRYRDELGAENWAACAAIFTDEPHLTADSHGPWGQGLHFSRLVQAEFARRRGYPVESVLADLYFDSPTSSATRFDFYETIHELWLQNFALPLEQWCRAGGIPLTGHYLEHDWPCPYATPGHVHLLAHMDWPGTDLLECFVLEGHDYPDPQNLDPAEAGTEPHALYFLKQVQSVANQFEKKRVMNESWGAGGHDSTPRDWLRIGRFLAVHGVNLFVPHFSPTTIRGARKKDHPQFFSEHSPWFEALGRVNDELGRLSWLVAQGRTKQRILVLDTLTTGYCMAAKGDCTGRRADDWAMEDTQRSLRPLRQAAGRLAQALSDAQADFDIGDEYLLAESGSIEGRHFRLGAQEYELLIVPPGLRNLRQATLDLLDEFSRAGGKILGLRPENGWIDGRPSDWPNQLNAEWVESEEALLSAGLRLVPPRMKISPISPSGVAHQRRECPEGIYYLVVNSSPAEIAATVSVADAGGLYQLDPQTGGVGRFDGTLRLAAECATIIFVDPSAKAAPAAQPPVVTTSIRGNAAGRPLHFLGAKLSDPNVLVVDTCALDVVGQSFPCQLVYESNRIFWEKNGMETNGWTSVIQYRDSLLLANKRMPPDSGGKARYTVEIERGVDVTGLDLCFECPDQWRLSVNGRPVDTTGCASWLDWRIARVPVGHLLHPGENVIELTAQPFDVRQEIDQIYLLGPFSVRPAERGFVLEQGPPTPGLGSWRQQGLPFYDRTISYRFHRPTGAGRLVVDEKAWHGSVLEVTWTGGRVTTFGAALDLEMGESENNEVTVSVTGVPLNLFGPWHKPNNLPKHGWSNAWHGGNVPNEPQPGTAYRHLDLGLFTAPRWI